MPNITIGRLRGGFCVIWHDASGRRRYRLEADNVRDAEAEAVKVYREKTMVKASLTIEEIWNAYIDDRSGRPIAETMRHGGKTILPHFGAYTFDQIDQKLCRAFTAKMRRKGLSDGTIWTYLGHLRTALGWAAKTARIIPYAPHIERPSKPAPKDRHLTRAEISRLLSADCEPHIRLACQLMLSTAARVTAVLELTWDRVDFQRGQIDLRKSAFGPRKGRAVVPMNDGLREALTKARRAALSAHVVEWNGKPVVSIRTGFMRACESAKLDDVSPHVLRHTAAVHMAEAGVPMAEISQYLGHSNVSITERVYARFSPNHLRKAASVLDFR